MTRKVVYLPRALQREKTRHYSDRFLIRLYQLAQSGFTNCQISYALGFATGNVVTHWQKKHPAVADALHEARKKGVHQDDSPSFREYVYARLSPHLQELWREINECEETPNDLRRIESLVENSGKTARQHLFLYALVHSSFNPSEACRKLHIPYRTYRNWVDDDPEFTELIDEIHIHKRNFFEERLVDLVKEGNPAATIFANKALNKDRGYSTQVNVNVTGKVEHEHQLSLDKLNLSLETRRQLLEAVRQAKQPPALTHKDIIPEAIEGEVLHAHSTILPAAQPLPPSR